MDPICTCHSIEFMPVDEQPQAFIAALDLKRRAQVLAACESVAMSLALGRPHGSRTAVIGNAKLSGLFVLRVVWPGLPEPQLRLICVRDGRRVLVARGFIQSGLRIPDSEIHLAEQAITRAGATGLERQVDQARRPRGASGPARL